VINQAIVVAKLSFQHIQSVYDSMVTGRISKQLCTIGMPSGDSNENLRLGATF
jgi:hypothetical protein